MQPLITADRHSPWRKHGRAGIMKPVLTADEDLDPTRAALLRRSRRTIAFVCVVVALAGVLVGWSAREWTKSVPRAPAQHQVAGSVSTFGATGLCVKPDDINTQPTCASTVALLPRPFRIAVGTRVRGTYAVVPSGDNAPGVFLWLKLEPSV